MDPLSIVIVSSLLFEVPKPVFNIDNNIYAHTIESFEKIDCDDKKNKLLCEINKKNKSKEPTN